MLLYEIRIKNYEQDKNKSHYYDKNILLATIKNYGHKTLIKQDKFSQKSFVLLVLVLVNDGNRY